MLATTSGKRALHCARNLPGRIYSSPVTETMFLDVFNNRVTLFLASRAQVNSLLAMDKELYIGTSWGCILVCNNLSLMVYTVIRCHDESVKNLLPLVTTPVASPHSTGEQTKALVLSIGRGYRSLGASLYGHTSYPSRRSGKTSLKNETAILVWLADSWES